MTLHLLHLRAHPIFAQLQIEEALLRTDSRNWCLINEGSPPAIVMGISGKHEELIHCEEARAANIPIIKRFSGGGTVIVDENTLFITFIFQKETHPFSFPEPIMRWSAEIYQSAFPLSHFSLKENDYVIGDKKCGGNAQYIKKERFLHHTSFLWDYSPHLMQLLKHPKKTPPYRQGRTHSDFLCRLKEFAPSQSDLIRSLKETLANRYALIEMQLKDLPLFPTHRQETTRS